MSKGLVISDASCLIALIDIDGLEILQGLFEEITITDIIREEVQHELPNWVKVSNDYDEKQLKVLELTLDRGEASAIVLALKEEKSLLVIDERKGREVAKKLGLKIIGTLGLIIKAKEKGLIEEGKPYIDKLIEKEFWISEKLKLSILRKLDEL